MVAPLKSNRRPQVFTGPSVPYPGLEPIESNLTEEDWSRIISSGEEWTKPELNDLMLLRGKGVVGATPAELAYYRTQRELDKLSCPNDIRATLNRELIRRGLPYLVFHVFCEVYSPLRIYRMKQHEDQLAA